MIALEPVSKLAGVPSTFSSLVDNCVITRTLKREDKVESASHHSCVWKAGRTERPVVTQACASACRILSWSTVRLVWLMLEGSEWKPNENERSTRRPVWMFVRVWATAWVVRNGRLWNWIAGKRAVDGKTEEYLER